MRAVRISEDIVPVSDFKAQAADWLKRVADTGNRSSSRRMGRPRACSSPRRSSIEWTERAVADLGLASLEASGRLDLGSGRHARDRVDGTLRSLARLLDRTTRGKTTRPGTTKRGS